MEHAGCIGNDWKKPLLAETTICMDCRDSGVGSKLRDSGVGLKLRDSEVGLTLALGGHDMKAMGKFNANDYGLEC